MLDSLSSHFLPVESLKQSAHYSCQIAVVGENLKKQNKHSSYFLSAPECSLGRRTSRAILLRHFIEAQMYNCEIIVCLHFSEGKKCFSWLDRDLALYQFNIYLLNSQILKVLLCPDPLSAAEFTRTELCWRPDTGRFHLFWSSSLVCESEDQKSIQRSEIQLKKWKLTFCVQDKKMVVMLMVLVVIIIFPPLQKYFSL